MDPERLQIIDMVNRSFGENNWSFSISNVTLDYINENASGDFSAGTSAVVRIQQTNGIYREDIGCACSSGPNKAEVIAKAKKEAVTDGLKGAVINFGGDIARKMNSLTPRKSVFGNPGLSSNCPKNSFSNTPATSPLQAAIKPSTVARSTYAGNPSSTQVIPSTNPAVAPKASPIPNKVVPIPRISPPLATPLPSSTTSCNTQISEEELAKIERKKRQKQLQEEFRKKHQEQAQSLTKTPEKKGFSCVQKQQPREPLQTKPNESNTQNCHGTHGSDGDDVLLSTQDIEAMVQIASNDTTLGKRTPMVSSPSIVRSSSTTTKSSSGSKRTDLSNFAFNPEKKPRHMQS